MNKDAISIYRRDNFTDHTVTLTGNITVCFSVTYIMVQERLYDHAIECLLENFKKCLYGDIDKKLIQLRNEIRSTCSCEKSLDEKFMCWEQSLEEVIKELNYLPNKEY